MFTLHGLCVSLQTRKKEMETQEKIQKMNLFQKKILAMIHMHPMAASNWEWFLMLMERIQPVVNEEAGIRRAGITEMSLAIPVTPPLPQAL